MSKDPTVKGYNLAYALGGTMNRIGNVQVVSSVVLVYTPGGDWVAFSPDLPSEAAILSFLDDAVKGINDQIKLRDMKVPTETKN